jgi:hypothetical protein
MTPEEYAIELIEKFSGIEDCDKHYNPESDGRICDHLAKACAIICVDEILKEQDSWVRALKRNSIVKQDADDSMLKSWQRVKDYLLTK